MMIIPTSQSGRVDGVTRFTHSAGLPRGSYRSQRRSSSPCVSRWRFLSNIVAPGGGSTPPTITWLSSPPTWQPITVIVRSHLTFSILSARRHAHGIGRAGGGSTLQSLTFAARRPILDEVERRAPPMSVANGREFLAIPGPTNIPDAVLAAMHRPATDIYSGDMLSITRTLLEDLPKIFRTSGKPYIYAANGHGGWEAAISNVLSRGETILVLESGLFAVGWGEMARIMGVKIEVLKGDWRRAVDPAAVTQRLKADTGHEIKAILAVQIDTASGVVNDIQAIRKA